MKKKKLTGACECYYSSCKYHPKDEPFCNEDDCRATEDELKVFKQERADYLKVPVETIGVTNY